MAITKTTAGGLNLRIKKPAHIYAQEVDSAGVPVGDEIFEFDEVLRDTTSLSQDDNDVSDIENEVSDTPIEQFITLGKYQFAATIEDVQAPILIAFLGFKSAGNTCYAPASYHDKYAKIVVVTRDQNDNLVALICPKVKLNSKMILESLNSALGGINLAGTAYNHAFPVFSDKAIYAKDDIVSKDNVVYRAKVDIATAATWDASEWEEIEGSDTGTPFIIIKNYTLPADNATVL